MASVFTCHAVKWVVSYDLALLSMETCVFINCSYGFESNMPASFFYLLFVFSPLTDFNELFCVLFGRKPVIMLIRVLIRWCIFLFSLCSGAFDFCVVVLHW